VYGIVKQSQGFISVSSEADEGAAFRIYFPSVPGSAEVGQTEENDQDDLRGSGTVLLVEDVKEVRQVTRLVLERFGYRVVEAANGDAALALASAQPGQIDLLLTDVVMPEMSGFELAERIREQWPGIRLLFMSGYANHTPATLETVEAGTPYLQKPFRGAVLARAVKEVLKAG
jgi:CheY-like chemotaxis protein